MLPIFLPLFFVLSSLNAFAGNTQEVPELTNPDLIVYNSLGMDWDGDGIYSDHAYLLKTEGEYLDLWVFYSSDTTGQYFHLPGVIADQTFRGDRAVYTIETNSVGSLQLIFVSFPMNPEGYTEVLTFAYRSNTMKLAGYTYEAREGVNDRRQCDVNTLTGRGILSRPGQRPRVEIGFQVHPEDRFSDLSLVSTESLFETFPLGYCKRENIGSPHGF